MDLKIKVLTLKMDKIFDHITKLIDRDPEYLFTEACHLNMKIYFKTYDKINKLKLGETSET